MVVGAGSLQPTLQGRRVRQIWEIRHQGSAECPPSWQAQSWVVNPISLSWGYLGKNHARFPGSERRCSFKEACVHAGSSFGERPQVSQVSPAQPHWRPGHHHKAMNPVPESRACLESINQDSKVLYVLPPRDTDPDRGKTIVWGRRTSKQMLEVKICQINQIPGADIPLTFR